MATKKKAKKKVAKKKAKKKVTKKKVTKKKIAKKKTGRPLTEINWDQVDNLCRIQCTGEEIAAVLNISYDTLERACKREQEVSFAEYIGQKRQGGRASLRRRQWQSALDGNVPMMIFLGKNYLDQRDRPEEQGNSDDLAELFERLESKLPG